MNNIETYVSRFESEYDCNVLLVVQIGSLIYGYNSDTSDEDYMFITDKVYTTCNFDNNIDIWAYSINALQSTYPLVHILNWKGYKYVVYSKYNELKTFVNDNCDELILQSAPYVFSILLHRYDNLRNLSEQDYMNNFVQYSCWSHDIIATLYFLVNYKNGDSDIFHLTKEQKDIIKATRNKGEELLLYQECIDIIDSMLTSELLQFYESLDNGTDKLDEFYNLLERLVENDR